MSRIRFSQKIYFIPTTIATMQAVLTQARAFFANPKKAREPCVTLGMSTLLVMTLASLNITFAVLLTSKEYVGSPLTCKKTELESYCATEGHFLPIGPDMDPSEDMRLAFYKYTPFVFLTIGKYTHPIS